MFGQTRIIGWSLASRFAGSRAVVGEWPHGVAGACLSSSALLSAVLFDARSLLCVCCTGQMRCDVALDFQSASIQLRRGAHTLERGLTRARPPRTGSGWLLALRSVFRCESSASIHRVCAIVFERCCWLWLLCWCAKLLSCLFVRQSRVALFSLSSLVCSLIAHFLCFAQVRLLPRHHIHSGHGGVLPAARARVSAPRANANSRLLAVFRTTAALIK